MTEPKALHITLYPDGVAAPAQRVVAIATQVVGTCLRALASDDLTPAAVRGGFVGYQFNGLEMSDEERRETYQNWVLSKGFQDLARGVRETLEEAAFYIAMAKREPGMTTWGAIEADMAAIRAEAAKLQFPQLLANVNAGLAEPMAFDAEFVSLQKARNCLEHRGGRVAARDVDPQTNVLTLKAERAYQRGTLLPRRIRLMEDWAKRCALPDNAAGNVVAIKGAA